MKYNNTSFVFFLEKKKRKNTYSLISKSLKLCTPNNKRCFN